MAEDISARVAWALKKALTPKDAATPSGRGTATFVRRDESGVGWVRITGNDFDTPVAGGIVAEAQPGDTVTYNIENNGVTITGNSTSPSVGGRFVGEALAPVRKAVSGLGGRVAASLNIAEAAQAVASAVNQHFWTDTSGIHVTEATQEAWQAAQTGANVLINSVGQLFRDGLNNLLTLTTEDGARALTIWDGLGNAAENIRAIIGETIQLGKADESHVELDYHSMQMLNKEGRTYFHASDLRDRSGVNGYTVKLQPSLSHVTGELVTIGAVYDIDDFNGECTVLFDGEPYTGTVEPIYDDPDGYFASVFGWKPIVGVTVGESVTGQDDRWTMLVEAESPFEIAFTFGERNPDRITAGGSSVFGSYCEASGFNSIAEGMSTKAVGAFSKAAGIACRASGLCAESSGYESNADGNYAHAEGFGAHANGDNSHAQNLGTIASSDSQTAIGKYNDNQSGNAFEIGNGSDANNRSNAFTVDWNGNVTANGHVSFADPYSGSRQQLGDPTMYQNSGNYAITTAGVTSLHNGPHITIPAGSYIFVGAWTFNTGNSSGQRNLQLGFRSGTSGDLWGERVRIMAAANNYAILNVSALRTFDAQTTVYLAGSSSMTSGSASAWITAVRLN